MKYVERCLWDYKANIAMLETLKLKAVELRSVHGHDYEAHSVNGISDPVAEVTGKILVLEKKIRKVSLMVIPVGKLEADLKGNAQPTRHIEGILKLRYFEHNNREYVQGELGLSRTTYWRRHDELMRLARKYLAEE